MNATLLGVIIGGVAGPLLLKALEWIITRARDRAEIRAVEQATDRDDLRMLLAEWKELHAKEIRNAETRHANQLDDWIRRIRGCVNSEPECQKVISEVEAEILRLRLERVS